MTLFDLKNYGVGRLNISITNMLHLVQTSLVFAVTLSLLTQSLNMVLEWQLCGLSICMCMNEVTRL